MRLFDWRGELARPSQIEPEGSWSVWVIMAGRGFGKTRSGAEWVREQVESGTCRRLALVAKTSADTRDVMVEGESGILAISPPWARPHYEPSKRRLTWPRPEASVTGNRISVGAAPSVATVFTAEEPDLLRGPQHDGAWADELAAWKYTETWDNLLLGLRIGELPRVVVTTTPKPRMFLREILSDSRTVVSGGSTYENLANLAPTFRDQVLAKYEGTSLGRQELHAELLDELEGALWTRKLIEAHRLQAKGEEDGEPLYDLPQLDKVVAAVDPAGSTKDTSSETGIVVAGRCQMTIAGQARSHYFVLEDGSGRHTPNQWATRAIDLLEDYEGDVVVGEKNNGGDMVEHTVHTVDPSVPFGEVWASRGKRPRASPVVAVYEQGRVHHVGGFPDLEDQMVNWEEDSGDPSPDRLDALVWALRYLMKGEDFPKPPTPTLGRLVDSDRPSRWRD